ncbi:MAG TPA: hypothetical protein VF263_18080, partial [Longimicrobiaceae bacterium]
MNRSARALALVAVAASAACGDGPTVLPAVSAAPPSADVVTGGTAAPVASGPEMDYQSSLIRVAPSG